MSEKNKDAGAELPVQTSTNVDIRLTQNELAELVQDQLISQQEELIEKYANDLAEAWQNLRSVVVATQDKTEDKIRKKVFYDRTELMDMVHPDLKVHPDSEVESPYVALIGNISSYTSWSNRLEDEARKKAKASGLIDVDYAVTDTQADIRIHSVSIGGVYLTAIPGVHTAIEEFMEMAFDVPNKGDSDCIMSGRQKNSQYSTFGINVSFAETLSFSLEDKAVITVLLPEGAVRKAWNNTKVRNTIEASLHDIGVMQNNLADAVRKLRIIKSSKQSLKVNLTRSVLNSTKDGKDLVKLIQNFQPQVKGGKLQLKALSDGK